MNFIEANNGINVRKESIVTVERIDDMSCKIVTSTGAYDCPYPSWRILMLLEQPDIENQIAELPQSPIDRTNLFGAQHWAG